MLINLKVISIGMSRKTALLNEIDHTSCIQQEQHRSEDTPMRYATILTELFKVLVTSTLTPLFMHKLHFDLLACELSE